MKRILIVVSYDGTEYSGFAAQKDPSVRTIEGELNRGLAELTGEDIHVIGASRTDAGVHALCNYAVFDTDSPIPAEKFAPALNTHLPEDIRVRQSKETAPDFHPRTVRTIKTYEYHIYNARIPDPTKRRFSYCTYARLDISRMREAAAYLVGEHDFASFANPSGSVQTTVREILSIEIEEHPCRIPDIMRTEGIAGQADRDSDTPEEPCRARIDTGARAPGNHPSDTADAARDIVIRVRGRGFLYNMVRIIVGTLIRAGRGQISPKDMPHILEARNRQAAGDTAPACGLWLVNYTILQ